MARNTKTVSKTSSKVAAQEIIHTLGGVTFSELANKLPAPNKYQELSSAQADKNIQAIRVGGQKTKMMIHTTAIGILLHYVNHGDYSRMIHLYKATAEAFSDQLANRLADWVEKFSTLRWKDGDTRADGHFVDSSKGKGMDAKSFQLSAIDPKTNNDVGAAMTPFWTVRGESGPTTLVYEMELAAKLFARLTALMSVKTEKGVKHSVSSQFITDFREFLEKHGFSFNEKGEAIAPDQKSLPYYNEGKEKGKATLIKKPRGTVKAAPKTPRAPKVIEHVAEETQTAA